MLTNKTNMTSNENSKVIQTEHLGRHVSVGNMIGAKKLMAGLVTAH